MKVSGESVALNVIDNVKLKIKFLHRQNRFLTTPLRRLLCNALIQPLFDYAGTAWFQNLSKKLRLSLQERKMHEVLLTTRQNVKNLRERVDRIKIRIKMHDRYLQFILSNILKFTAISVS